VLNDFKGCQPQKLVTPSGDGRWMGYGYVVRAGAFTDEFTPAPFTRGASAEVGKTQLAAKIGLGRIPEEEEVTRRQAEKAVSALARNDVPKVGNAAIAYVKEMKDWSESYAVTGQDNQVYVAAADGAFLCAVAGQRVLLVQRVTSPKNPGMGSMRSSGRSPGSGALRRARARGSVSSGSWPCAQRPRLRSARCDERVPAAA